MPFTRLQELGTLAASIDTAMARNDDIGMDMMRDLLPELRETIDDVNTALREVDALLFEGLRDEAVTLHDPEFPVLAARLHLEDRGHWPELQAFFTAEGINLPPRIDFDTLTALESAHAELEELRRPLDRLRRLNLERAPLQRRLAMLRKLRETDPTKPVWTQAIAAHEEARVGELHEAVRTAIQNRDPFAISALHAELVDPEWGIPVPRDLVRNTRGADIWMRMREVAAQAEAAAAELEAGHAEAAQAPPTPDLVARQRQSRQAWLEAEATLRECLAALAECPQIAAIVREEALESRLATQAPRVQEPLRWLTVEDAREALVLQHQQVCGQLEYLVDHPPDRKGDESTWLAGVGRLEADLLHCCQAEPSLGYPELLRERVRGAAAEVRGREARRRRLFMLAVGSGVLAACGLVWALWSWRSAAANRMEAVRTLKEMLAEAEQGAYAEVPESAADLLEAYADDRKLAAMGDDIEEAVERERKRRGEVATALADFTTAVATARAALEKRERDETPRLDAWDPAVLDAADAWREARRRGGEHAKRQPAETAGLPLEKRPVAAQDALKAEEARIATARQDQEDLEADFAKAAIDELRRQKAVIEAAIPKDGAPDRAATARKLLADLKRLVETAREPKSGRIDKLLGDPLKRNRVPFSEIEAATLLTRPLERLAKDDPGS
jgi:hypothetical protein